MCFAISKFVTHFFQWVGSEPPYGYNKVKLSKEKGYTLQVNQEEAKIVKLIFDLSSVPCKCFAFSLHLSVSVFTGLSKIDKISASFHKASPDFKSYILIFSSMSILFLL